MTDRPGCHPAACACITAFRHGSKFQCSRGRLLHSMMASMVSWSLRQAVLARYLHTVDVAECHQRAAAVRQQQALEASVAAAAGLAMVYSVPSLRLQPALGHFLERLAAASAERGPIGGGTYRAVPLCIVSGQVRVGEHWASCFACEQLWPPCQV